MKKLYTIFFLSVIAGVIALIISMLILPTAINFEDELNNMNLLAVANLLSWAGIIITFIALIFLIIAYSKQYYSKYLILSIISSLIITVVLLCSCSYIYIALAHGKLLRGQTELSIILNFYSYPTLVTLALGDPQPIWLISTTLFVAIFNLNFYYLTQYNSEGGK